ncbi:MAG: zf-HC2 domain-containing protein [Lysinibacillus sp.]
MNECRIAEDLLPLYEEDLLHKETVDWMEAHLSTCERCRARAKATLGHPPEAKPKKSALAMMQSVKSKLAVYQLLFVLLSFSFAMGTSLLAGSFQFILSYFILGLSTFYFYRSWAFTLSISMVPIVLWSIYDTIASYGSYNEWYMQAGEGYDSLIGLFGMLIGDALLMGVIHTAFAVLGAVVALLLAEISEKENT